MSNSEAFINIPDVLKSSGFDQLYKEASDLGRWKTGVLEPSDSSKNDDPTPILLSTRTHIFDDWIKRIDEKIKFYETAIKVLDEVPCRFTWWKTKKIYETPLKNEIEKTSKAKKVLEQYSKQYNHKTSYTFSFLNNSSIWVRLIDKCDDKENEMAKNEFGYFEHLGLYKYKSAKEYLDYHLRAQPANYLKLELGTHGKYVSPMLYGNEVESRKILQGNFVDIRESNGSIEEKGTTEQTSKSTEGNEGNEKSESNNNNATSESKDDKNGGSGSIKRNITYKFFEQCHDVVLRILVVDDNIGPRPHNSTRLSAPEDGKPFEIKIKTCSDCEGCCTKHPCKLRTIRQLMGYDNNCNSVDEGDPKQKCEKSGKESNLYMKAKIFEGIGGSKDYFYWKEAAIECYYCPDVMEDFIDNEAAAEALKDYDRIQALDKKDDAADLGKAGAAFKIVFQNDGNDGESPGFVQKDCKNIQIVGVRDVHTALLLLTRYKFDMIFLDYLLDQKQEHSEERDYSIQFFDFLTKQYKDSKLRKLRRDVLDNRGPLDRFWIMPITGFNETFIKDLGRNGVPLISHKWHIDNGANPITTPWQFLDKLNRFIELQLNGCLYTRKKLLEFLQYTGEDFQQEGEKTDFDAYQAFMGAEYASFMNHFGSRFVIKRDATSKNSADQSVFAAYIWEKFYKQSDDKQLFPLYDRMQQFYQIAASIPNDHSGQLRLRESFRRLHYFIDVQQCKLEDKNRFDNALEKIANAIDGLEA